MSRYQLGAGDPAPTFFQRSFANPRYAFGTAAGRYVVLCFFGSAGDEHAQAAIAAMRARPDIFDDHHASFFGVSIDPGDEAERRVTDSYPGYRYFWDFDLTVCRAYGVVDSDTQPGASIAMRRCWFVLDPTLHILHLVAFQPDRSDIDAVIGIMEGLRPPSLFMGFETPAPVIFLHNIFEPGFCRHLIDLYEREGGTETGFMRDKDGKTIAMLDPGHKRRRDVTITDTSLIEQIQARFQRRILPEIAKIHHYRVQRMERYIIACYAAEDGGHFRPHRDNTTRGTAHRRFAVSVNLNDDFEGGEVSFPEYGPRSYKMPAGGAVIFSCSMLHMVSTVTAGRRFAFLPFLYDDEAAAIREANNAHLGEGVGAYPGAETE